ncbi:GNAT family N-acetyltransferase [Dactylosporangium sp. CA-139066]|uniref:GNAT family N-acetyltransferase n=1 Tax=Dactylosporangium sp. CA-139066 TaxID=3239930 RepID=UPI003D94648D
MEQPTPVLRPVTAADLWVLERQADEPDAGGVFNWSGFRDIAGTRRRFEEHRLITPDAGCLVVQVPEGVAGVVTWCRVSYGVPAWSCWNIGIQLLPEFRGRGLGGPAQQRLVAYLFDTTPVERVEAYTDVENVAEQRALERAGFTLEGTVRSAQFREGRWRTVHLYSVLRDEFKAADPRT